MAKTSNPSGVTLTTATATGTITDTAVTVTPPPTTSGGSVTYTVADNWGSGFTGTMNVTAGQALNGWTVSFNTPAEIVNAPVSSRNESELPMEYALEPNRLIELQMEGAVG